MNEKLDNSLASLANVENVDECVYVGMCVCEREEDTNNRIGSNGRETTFINDFWWL